MLETKNGQRNGYSVYLPVSIHTYTQVIERLKEIESGVELQFESYKNTNYFGDKKKQRLCADFMQKRNQ